MSPALKSQISQYFSDKPISKAWIFGSYATNSVHKGSDIDILVEFTDTSNITLFYYAKLINELEKLTGKKIDLAENGQLKSFAIDSVNKQKQLIYERKTT